MRIENVKHRFDDFWALRGITLDVQPGEFLTLLGPSGSGKTTLLRVISGMLYPTEGRLLIGGQDMTRIPPQKRNMGFVFQNYALFPHMTVFDNVAFPLKLRKVKKQEIATRVQDALRLVELEGLDRRYPGQLSGGQQQRVSLARAVVFRPTVLLMDEPLGSLDKRLRQQLQIELRRLQREINVTAIYVTHDQEEAFSMSDRIAVMHQGEIAQLGAPPDIYRAPVTPFIANFVGDLNRFEGELVSSTGGTAVVRTTDGMDIKIPSQNGTTAGHVICGVRPERLQVARKLETDNAFAGTLRVMNFQFGYYRAQVDLPSGQRLLAEIHQDNPDVHEGEEVNVGWQTDDALVFMS
jgi:spermidine/putrescine ABC transporter ATP-binding subunit